MTASRLRRVAAFRARERAAEAVEERTLAPDAPAMLYPAMPEALARDLRRLLAEALVRDYLADHKDVNPLDGDVPLGDASPSDDDGREPADER